MSDAGSDGLSEHVVTCPECDYRETWLGEKAAFHDAQSHWHMMSHLTGEEHDATYTAKYREPDAGDTQGTEGE